MYWFGSPREMSGRSPGRATEIAACRSALVGALKNRDLSAARTWTANILWPKVPACPWRRISASSIVWRHAMHVKDAPRPTFGALGGLPVRLSLTISSSIWRPTARGSIQDMAPLRFDNHHVVVRTVSAPHVGFGHTAVLPHNQKLGTPSPPRGKCAPISSATAARTRSAKWTTSCAIPS